MFFEKSIEKAQIFMEKSEEETEENVEKLAKLCRTELLVLLQEIAGRKLKNNPMLRDIVNAKIATLQEDTSVLRAEIRTEIQKSGSNGRWKEVDITNNLVGQFVDAFTRRVQKATSAAKGLVSISRRASLKERRVSTPPIPPSASSSRAMGPSRSRTPTLSLNDIDYPTSETPSSQRPLLLVSEQEQTYGIDEMMTTRAEEYIIGRSSTLGPLTEAPESPLPVEETPELDLGDICASPANLNAHISENVVKPFLQSVRVKMTQLADARVHHMEKVYERTILGVMAECEKAIKDEEDRRQRTPEDQRVRSTLAQLQLWANVTAAVSAIEALTKAREAALEKPTDIGSPVFSPISL